MQRLLHSSMVRMSIVAAMCVAVFGALVTNVRPATATPNIGPDPDFISLSTYYGASYGSGVPRNYLFAVAYSDSAQIITSKIKIYMPTPTGTITIRDPHMCTERNEVFASPYSYYTQSDRVYTASSGDASRFRMTNTGSGSWTGYGSWDSSFSCGNKTLSFTVSGSTVDANTGMYPYFLETTALTNGKFTNTYDITAPSGAIISPDVTQSAESFGMRHSSPMSPTPDPSTTPPPHPYRNYSTWELPFAPDCSVTTPTTQNYIEFYDDDNRGGDGAQLQPFWLQMREYDRSGNFLGVLPPVGARWTTSGVWSSTFTSPTTNTGGGWIKQSANGSEYDYVYTKANLQTFRVYYNFNRDRVYRLAIFNVFYMNTLQLRTPFESVYYYRPCQLPQATLQPSSAVDKALISYPETATFSHYLNVSNFSSSGTVNYSIQRYRNGSVIGSPQTGTQAYGSNGQTLIRTNAYTSSAGDAGARICERLTLSGTGTFVNNPSESCTTVVQRPYIEAANNDIWAGSWFDQNNNLCAGLPSRSSSISSWVNSGGGAVGEYGVLALGPITEFGSARAPGGNGLTFSNSPTDGTLGASVRCIPNYYGTINTSGAVSWPGVSSLPAGAGKVKYAVNGNLTIGAGTVPAGTQAVLLVNGNVTLTGNIGYANSYTSQNAISSLWIVATGHIYIRENVTSLAGFYVAQGTSANAGRIHTCVQASGVTYNPLTTGVCNLALTVNGALMADQIYWQRTGGTAAPGQNASESIQFDPGLYLSSPLSSGAGASGGDIQDSIELPPIY